MVARLVNNSGECTSCKEKKKRLTYLIATIANPFFVHFVERKSRTAMQLSLETSRDRKPATISLCACLTRRETKEASALKDQIEALTERVIMLVSEFKIIEEQKQVVEAIIVITYLKLNSVPHYYTVC